MPPHTGLCISLLTIGNHSLHNYLINAGSSTCIPGNGDCVSEICGGKKCGSVTDGHSCNYAHGAVKRGWVKMQGMENARKEITGKCHEWKMQGTEGVQYNRARRYDNTDKVSK